MKLDWGKSIFIFFVLFLSLATVFIVFSFKHRNDLVTDNYYEEGAAYTKQLTINKRSAIYTDSLSIEQQAAKLTMVPAKSILEHANNLEVYFYNPSDKQKDYFFTLDSLIDSLDIKKSNLSHGRYILKLKWHMHDEQYYLEKDVFID